jgi:hypothetical protein
MDGIPFQKGKIRFEQVAIRHWLKDSIKDQIIFIQGALSHCHYAYCVLNRHFLCYPLTFDANNKYVFKEVLIYNQ